MDLNVRTGIILITLLTINCFSLTAAQSLKEDKLTVGSGLDQGQDVKCTSNCDKGNKDNKNGTTNVKKLENLIEKNVEIKPSPPPTPKNKILEYLKSSYLVKATCAIIVLCALIAVVGYCTRKKKTIQKRHRETKNEPEQTTLIVSRSSVTAPKTLEEVCQKYSIRIFNSNDVKIMANIGSGCFGEVFQGLLGERKVAVKKARSEFSALVTQEIEAMGPLSHVNILSLIGIVQTTDSDSPGLIFDFMEYGDLQEILRESNPKLDQTNAKYLLAQDTLGIVAWQIANGMKYMSAKRVVHRDLAARNCLMSGKGVVKISDFGLSRDLYTNDYYKIPDWDLAKGTNRRLPFRWLSPENLQYGSFTVESDVWAYGMVLLEIYSWGSMPYCGISNQEACNMILAGIPPPISLKCPSVIEHVMERCWRVEPKCRMTFHQICDEFENHAELTQYSKGGSLVELKIDASGYLVPK